MSIGGEAADTTVKYGLEITETTVKLAALGAKNLAAMLTALASEDTKVAGKSTLKKLLKSDKPLCILQIKEKDLKEFNKLASKYGVLFTAVSDKTNNTGLCDVIAKQDDVATLNHIMDKLGYIAPEVEIEPEIEKEKTDAEKKASPRAEENQHENESTKHGELEKTDSGTEHKPSVRAKVEKIKKDQNEQRKRKIVERERPNTHTHSNRKKKKRKKKGKTR